MSRRRISALLTLLALLLLAGDASAQLIRKEMVESAILDSSAVYCSDAGFTDAYACNLSPALTAYVTGGHYRFRANTSNTGPASINFNSLGARTIKKAVGGVTTDLADNDIRAGQIVDVVYDGTNMQLQSTLGNLPSGSGIGDALTSNPLSQFAATTSAQLAGVISNETGTGALVFGTSPTIVTPTIASFAGAAHDHDDAAGGGQLNATAVFSAGTVPTARLGSGSANSTSFLRGDQTWTTPAGAGDVAGPASATDNAIARFDATTGKLLQNSNCTIADTGALTCGDVTTNSWTPNLIDLSGHRQTYIPGTANSVAVVPKDCNALIAGNVVKGVSTLGIVDCMTPGPATYNDKTVDPTTTDNTSLGYNSGDIWINTTATPDKVWIKTSESGGVASWIQLG